MVPLSWGTAWWWSSDPVSQRSRTDHQWQYVDIPVVRSISFPHYFAATILAFCSLIAFPRRKWRLASHFSLRTLLIGMTMVAIALGWVVWLLS
jgi:hypothetical protein